MEPADLDILIGLAVAVGVGFAIGLERGWKEIGEADQRRSAGVRTFSLVGLLGGLCGWGEGTLTGLILLGLAAVLLLALAGYLADVYRGSGVGLTTEVALLLTFLLGVLSGLGFWTLAASLAAVIALILALKTEIHALVGGLDRRELLATLQLLVLAVLVVPLLPNREVLGLEGLNPRVIGVLALLISLISYVGYFSVAFLGTRAGLLLTAVLGGLASSTAVTASYARMARHEQDPNPALGVGIALACAFMGLRVLVLAAIVAPTLLTALLAPMLSLSLVLLGAAAVTVRRRRVESGEAALTLTNPLALRASVLFAGALAVLFVLVPLIREAIGAGGVVLLAALSGVADVDAISLSLARDGRDGDLPARVAVVAITTAAISNTLVKAGLTWVGSGGHLKGWAATLAAAAGAALLAALLAARLSAPY